MAKLTCVWLFSKGLYIFITWVTFIYHIFLNGSDCVRGNAWCMRSVRDGIWVVQSWLYSSSSSIETDWDQTLVNNVNWKMVEGKKYNGRYSRARYNTSEHSLFNGYALHFIWNLNRQSFCGQETKLASYKGEKALILDRIFIDMVVVVLEKKTYRVKKNIHRT